VSGPALTSSTSEVAPTELVDNAPPAAAETPALPAAPAFKFSTFLLTFLFVMGIYMLFDTSARNGVAMALNGVLYPAIGFTYSFPLLTMFLAAVLEMLITAIAYNYTTDWVKQAKVGKWNTAFRKIQMEAMRSGKKDRIEALKPFQQQLTMLSSEVSIAQLKGMAVTWFLVIAIYTWVGLFIKAAYNYTVGGVAQPKDLITIGGTSVHLYLGVGGIAFLPLWFLIFSLYTIPSSIAFRRVLKHYWLVRHARTLPPVPGSPGVSA
jgi:uncharacterized membrane protein (DUF106 family)